MGVRAHEILESLRERSRAGMSTRAVQLIASRNPMSTREVLASTRLRAASASGVPAVTSRDSAGVREVLNKIRCKPRMPRLTEDVKSERLSLSPAELPL